MSRIAGVVIAKNEERQIGGCLASLAWADERLVLDSGSTDRTPEVVRSLGCRLATRPFTNFAEQRNAALEQTECEWVFFLDADERVSQSLAKEIRVAVDEAGECNGYWVPRRNWILGHRMRGGGWWPDEQLRLLRRDRARYDTTMGVHEVARVEGELRHLNNAIFHDNYQHLGQLFRKQDLYSRHAAEDLRLRGIRPRPHQYVLQPLRAFRRRFIEWHGYRDGLFGAFLAGLLAWYELVTYVRVGEKGKGERGKGKDGRRGGVGGWECGSVGDPATPPQGALTGVPSGSLSLGKEKEQEARDQPVAPTYAAQRSTFNAQRSTVIPPSAFRLPPSVVIVSWNVCELLAACLDSLQGRAAGDDVGEIVVVDNGSRDGTIAMIRERFPAVRLIEAPDNPGFAASNNRGAAATAGDLVLLLNPDTVVRPGAIRAMVGAIAEDDRLGAVGPRLLNGDGTVQSSRRRFPTPATLLVQSTPLDPWVRQLPGSLPGWFLDDLDWSNREPDWLVGACVLMRRSAWEQTGGLDDGYFMYFEETDWFRRAATLGWKPRFVSTAEVVHHYGKSSEQNLAVRQLRFTTSKVRYARVHHGAIYARLLAGYLRLMIAGQAAIEGAKWLIGHKRPLRSQRIDQLGRVLRASWTDVPVQARP